MEKIVMFNPKNNVKIITNQCFQPKWEKLGFVPLKNVTLLRMAG